MSLGNEHCEILPAGTRLRLLRDRILLRPLDWTPSDIIAVVRAGRPLRGIIEAVGPGRLYRRYKAHAYDRNKRVYTETSTFIPTQVKPGDVVELGGLNAYDGAGYNFPQVMIGTQRFLIIQEQDVAFFHDSKLDKPSEEGLSVEHHGTRASVNPRAAGDHGTSCSDLSEDGQTPAGTTLVAPQFADVAA